MATTLATFYSNLQSLSVTGVVSLSNPPAGGDLVTANMPCKWVDNLGFDEVQLVAKGIGGDRTLRARVVVVTDAKGQDIHSRRWTVARAMADTLDTALKTLGTTYQLMSYTVDVDPAILGQFMGVTATVEVPAFG